MSSDSQPGSVGRRRLLTGATGVGASYYASRLAAAGADWSPTPHPMAESIFVLDGVAHCYNHSEINKRIKRAATTGLDVSYQYHSNSTPERYRMSPAQYHRDWQPEEVVDVMFLESHTDMIVMHSVPIYDQYWDGLVSNEKGAFLKDKYPDRVLWYGAVDMFDSLENIKRKIDQLVFQGMDGIKFYPTRINFETRKPEAWLMDDAGKAYPVFEYCREKGIQHVATHKLVGYVDASTPALGINDYYKAAADFPDLTFHIVHGGWLLFEDTAELMKQRQNVTAVLEGPMLWTIYDMNNFHRMMDVFMRKVDIERIIYASTSPNQHPYWIINKFFDYEAPDGVAWKITAADKAKILGGNLARYHGIDPKARRAAIASDRFSRAVRASGLREPYVLQRAAT